ncbi:MAG: hypothetical protein ACOYM3_19865, partial [Terrimicrobiaceae bacterium]
MGRMLIIGKDNPEDFYLLQNCRNDFFLSTAIYWPNFSMPYNLSPKRNPPRPDPHTIPTDATGHQIFGER